MSREYKNEIVKKLERGKTVENHACPICGETLKLILFGLIPDDSPVVKALRNGAVSYMFGGCCCYGDDRDPTYYCTNCKKGFSEKLVLLEKVSCPLEASGEIFKYECRDYEALKKNKRYRLLKDTEKICNIICPAIGKDVDIHTYDGRTIRGTITRSINYTCDVKENHVIVNKKTEDSYRSEMEDVFIKDIESIDILGTSLMARPWYNISKRDCGNGGNVMSRGENQKLKLAYLTKIMLEKTDEEHALTLAQIIQELEARGVTAERKSLYNDFADMTDKLGVEIIKEQIGRDTFYHVGSREFELAEIKLLIDAIQSSKFITEKKSRELIKKIKGFVSEHQASQLQRQVFVQGRAKTMNESIYYNVDDIHKAIGENRKISFKYYRWDVSKKLVERNHGLVFTVSPWALTWDDENYYLVAFDDYDKKIKHYRVDKMKQITILEERRDGKDEFKDFDMAAYSKMNFGMYNGRKEIVKFEFSNYMVGVFFDRFGKDIPIRAIDEKNSETHVEVAVSPQFFAWVMSLGNEVKLTGPNEVVEEMKKYVEDFLAKY